MNYYRRYMADYNSKTAALSMAEHGAYTLLLDHYYSTEVPLPASLDALYRLCRAMTKPEQQAVKSVAEAFFPVSGDGLRHNLRADGEIEKAKPVIEAARTNGVKGGRPRNNPTGSETETRNEPAAKASQPLISQPLAFQPSTAQPPTKREATPRGSRLLLDTLPDEWKVFCQAERTDLDPARVFADFSDYWKAKPGKDGVKLDWLATWRKWVRNSREGRAATSGKSLLQLMDERDAKRAAN